MKRDFPPKDTENLTAILFICDRLGLVRIQSFSSLGLSSGISKMHRKHGPGVNIYLN